MSSDVMTVAWKEWREFRDQLLNLRRGGISALVLVLVLGVVTPVQMGPDWVRSPLMAAYWPFIAASMVSSLIADSVAGERERHTLETLLASRLPDGAILGGKVIAAVLYGVALAAVNLLVGLVSVNVAHGDEGPVLFAPVYLGTLLLLTTLTCTLVAGLGVFVSLRAATVKQAQQTFGIAMVMIVLAPVLFFQAVPNDVKVRVLGFLSGERDRMVWYTAGALATASLVVLALAWARFRRGKLTLD